MGRHALGFVGFGGGVGAKFVLGHHRQAAHQVHRLGRAVHRHVDGLALSAGAVVGLRGLGRRFRRGRFAAVTVGVRRRGLGRFWRRGVGRGRRGRHLDLVHCDRLLGQRALGTLVQVRLHSVRRACHIGQALEHLVGAGQQAVGDVLQFVGALGQIGGVGGIVPGRAAALAGGLGGGALLGIALHAGPHQGADRGHRLTLALVLGRRQQRLLCGGKGSGVQHLGLAVLDQAARDAEQRTVLAALGRHSQEVGLVTHLHPGVKQAAGLDACHKGQVVVIVGQVGAAIQVKRAFALLGGIVVVDRQRFEAVGAVCRIQREAAVLFQCVLIGQRLVVVTGAFQHGVAGGGGVQGAGGGKTDDGPRLCAGFRRFGRGRVGRVDQRAIKAGPAQVGHHACAAVQRLVKIALGGGIVQRRAVALGGRAGTQIIAEEHPQRPGTGQHSQQQHDQDQRDRASAAALALFNNFQTAVFDAGRCGLLRGQVGVRICVLFALFAGLCFFPGSLLNGAGVKQLGRRAGKVLNAGALACGLGGVIGGLGSGNGGGVKVSGEIGDIIVQHRARRSLRLGLRRIFRKVRQVYRHQRHAGGRVSGHRPGAADAGMAGIFGASRPD